MCSNDQNRIDQPMSSKPDAAEPVPYIRRSHDYYEAQGFERRYRYAHFETAPFARLPKPLSESTLVICRRSQRTLYEAFAHGVLARRICTGAC